MLASFRDVLRSPNLRRLELGYAASLVGLWSYSIAVSIYAFRIGGATLVGVTMLLKLAPAAVAAPFAAVLADRYSRRRVLVVTDLTRALFIAAAAVAVVADAPPRSSSFAGVVTVVSTAFEPAKNALVPALTERPDQLTAANVVTSAFESSSIFLARRSEACSWPPRRSRRRS